MVAGFLFCLARLDRASYRIRKAELPSIVFANRGAALSLARELVPKDTKARLAGLPKKSPSHVIVTVI